MVCVPLGQPWMPCGAVFVVPPSCCSVVAFLVLVFVAVAAFSFVW